MKLLSVVRLKNDHPEHNLKAGSQGTIVEIYNNNNYGVEFSDENGKTEALAAFKIEELELIWEPKEN